MVKKNEFILKHISNKLPIEKGFIYYFQVDTSNSKNDNYATDQVHYFTIIYDDNPVLIQTFGGISKILVKYFYRDINILLKELLNKNIETYRKMFELSEEFNYLLEFDNLDMIYIKQTIKYPTLKDLDNLISPLPYAKDKLSFII